MLTQYFTKETIEASFGRGIWKSISGCMTQFWETGGRNSGVLMHSWVTRDKSDKLYFQ